MNFLGPVGLTVAFVWGMSWLQGQLRKNSSEVVGDYGIAPTRLLDGLARSIDYRLIVAGTLVPDFIDKPLAFLVNPGFVNGSLRSVGHSVAGGLMLLTIAWVVARGRLGTIVGSFGFALTVHLLVDQMWDMPEVLFWPLHGWVLTDSNVPFPHWYRVHFAQLPTALPDYVGIAMLTAFIVHTVLNRSVAKFFKTGKFS